MIFSQLRSQSVIDVVTGQVKTAFGALSFALPSPPPDFLLGILQLRDGKRRQPCAKKNCVEVTPCCTIRDSITGCCQWSTSKCSAPPKTNHSRNESLKIAPALLLQCCMWVQETNCLKRRIQLKSEAWSY